MASSTFSIPFKKAATRSMKDHNRGLKDIFVLPYVPVDKHPGLHQPHAIGITLLNGIYHAVTAAGQVRRVHRLGLQLREEEYNHVHLHEKITIVEMGSSTVKVSAVKETKATREDIIVL